MSLWFVLFSLRSSDRCTHRLDVTGNGPGDVQRFFVPACERLVCERNERCEEPIFCPCLQRTHRSLRLRRGPPHPGRSVMIRPARSRPVRLKRAAATHMARMVALSTPGASMSVAIHMGRAVALSTPSAAIPTAVRVVLSMREVQTATRRRHRSRSVLQPIATNLMLCFHPSSLRCRASSAFGHRSEVVRRMVRIRPMVRADRGQSR